MELIMRGRITSPPTCQFIGIKSLTFSKEEHPLEAEAWIKAIEAKFSAFVLPCSEENKANFAALQL
jgi:hypothetical protein